MKTSTKWILGIGAGLGALVILSKSGGRASENRVSDNSVDSDDPWTNQVLAMQEQAEKLLEESKGLEKGDCAGWASVLSGLASSKERMIELVKQKIPEGRIPSGFWKIHEAAIGDISEVLKWQQLTMEVAAMCMGNPAFVEGFRRVQSADGITQVILKTHFASDPGFIELTDLIAQKVMGQAMAEREGLGFMPIEDEGYPQPTRKLSQRPDALVHYKPVKASSPGVSEQELLQVLKQELSEIEPFFSGVPPDIGAIRYLAALWDINGSELSEEVLAELFLEQEGATFLPKIRANTNRIEMHLEAGVRGYRPRIEMFFSAFAYDPAGGSGEGTTARRKVLIKKLPPNLSGVMPSHFEPYQKHIAYDENQAEGLALAMTEIVWHELMHVIECSNPRIHGAAETFLRWRTRGEEPRALNSFEGLEQLPANIFVMADKFFHPYVGVTYPVVPFDYVGSQGVVRMASTEVLTMSLALLTHPLGVSRFWDLDRMHFALISAVLRGKFGYY